MVSITIAPKATNMANPDFDEDNKNLLLFISLVPII